MKYILVSGGGMSGLGKGVIASSTGLLMKTTGLKVTSIKVDPYLNVDAGTMSPTEHGEVFVLDDGGETDLDLGNYERYLNIKLTREHNITTGKIYLHVINAERTGDYLGKTVQVVPHLTNAVSDWIERVARIPVDDTKEEPDVCIVELGGTVGDIESGTFVEAMRTLRRKAGRGNFLQIHVTHVPVLGAEQKTKPTQQAIQRVREVGLSPDLIACRCAQKLEASVVEKIAHFCQVELDQVIAVHDVNSTYHVPMLLEAQGLVTHLQNILGLKDVAKPADLQRQGRRTWQQWQTLVTAQDRLFDTVTIALIGKYSNPHESYLSVIKSLEHAAMHCRHKLELIYIKAEHLEDAAGKTDPAHFHKAWHQLCTASGIIIPGGFGFRATEGMIAAAQWARENKTPYLGVCLGMQLAVVEFARNICGIRDALSEEFASTDASQPERHSTNHLIINMPEVDKTRMGGTMRLGLRATLFQPGSGWSVSRRLYQSQAAHTAISQPSRSDAATAILERHRHRYEVNPSYIDQLSNAGLAFVGRDEQGERMEICELDQEKFDHPFYVGVQYHPEYLSRVLKPSVPYLGLVAASCGMLEDVLARVLQERGANGEALSMEGLAEALDGSNGQVNGEGVKVNGHA